jgi:hypothetical protein
MPSRRRPLPQRQEACSRNHPHFNWFQALTLGSVDNLVGVKRFKFRISVCRKGCTGDPESASAEHKGSFAEVVVSLVLSLGGSMRASAEREGTCSAPRAIPS